MLKSVHDWLLVERYSALDIMAVLAILNIIDAHPIIAGAMFVIWVLVR
jgi:hypothetical protein